MKSIIRIALASLLISGAANVYADSDSSNFFPRSALHNWHGDGFMVQRLEFLRKRDIFRGLVINWALSHPDKVHELQSAILRNRSLAAALREKNVEIRNIVAVQIAGNGSLVVYLR